MTNIPLNERDINVNIPLHKTFDFKGDFVVSKNKLDNKQPIRLKHKKKAKQQTKKDNALSNINRMANSYLLNENALKQNNSKKTANKRKKKKTIIL